MDNLRQKLSENCFIPLTPYESEYWHFAHKKRDPSWLAEHRNDPSTHPYFTGPFTEENIQWYHIYCSYETMNISFHCSYPESIYSYNNPHGFENHMCLPIAQRSMRYKTKIPAEIFDDQCPEYEYYDPWWNATFVDATKNS